ncbi:MAG: sigma-70 family RNA polymerase sigma factor [Rhodanobacteraceae bacterium]
MGESGNLENTTRLIGRIRAGDGSARECLISRYLPMLRKWAHGRLPSYGRDLSETDDLVQITFLRALNRLESFESQRPGAFLAYLRTILMNAVREELRRRRTSPATTRLLDTLPSPQASVVEQAIGGQTLEAYERALSRLPENKRMGVMMRIEFEMSFQEIADELEMPSANASRMMVVRAIEDLAGAMTT